MLRLASGLAGLARARSLGGRVRRRRVYGSVALRGADETLWRPAPCARLMQNPGIALRLTTRATAPARAAAGGVLNAVDA